MITPSCQRAAKNIHDWERTQPIGLIPSPNNLRRSQSRLRFSVPPPALLAQTEAPGNGNCELTS